MSIAPPAAFDGIADRYDQSRGGTERGDRFARAISPLLVPGGPNIEIGIGTALVADGLRRLGHEVVGVDISAGMLSYARQRMPGLVGLADAMALPFRTGTAANCYAIWVMHMVPDLDTALAEAHRVLKSGGRLIACSVNNGATPDPIGQIVHEMQTRLIGAATSRRDIAAGLLGHAKRAGFVVIPGEHQVVQSYRLAPAAMAQTIEARGFSSLRDVPSGQWAEIVVPAIRALRQLPEADQPLERRTAHDLLVLEKP